MFLKQSVKRQIIQTSLGLIEEKCDSLIWGVIDPRVPCMRMTLEVVSDVMRTRSVVILVPEVGHELRKLTLRYIGCRGR